MRFTALVGLGFILGVALAAPLLVPFLDYLNVAYVGAHGQLFRSIHLPTPLIPLQVLPYLYGEFATASPAALHSVFGNADYVRMPGWISLPVLFFALAAIVRPRHRVGLRFVLLAWVAVWEMRYLGFGPVTWLVNWIPGVASADSTRFSGPPVNFALYVLCAMGFDDHVRRHGLGLRPAQIMPILLATIGAAFAAVLPVLRDLPVWYAAHPRSMMISLASIGLAAVALGLIWIELRRPRHARALAGLVLVSPLLLFVIPQFAGVRSGHIDRAPIRYLRHHIGLARMASLGPLGLNFPARYGIASINYSALPVPALWTGFIVHHLFAGADVINYSGDQPGQERALIYNVANYEALGVRYVVAGPNWIPYRRAFSLVNPARRNIAHVLPTGSPGITGTIASPAAFRSIGAMSVVVGTFMGVARGPVTARLCAAGTCVAATEDAAAAADNSPLSFVFRKPLDVPEHGLLTWQISQSAGRPLAVWYAPSVQGGEQPTLSLFTLAHGVTLRRVFHDAATSIYELPHPAPYVSTTNPACAVRIVSRRIIRTDCPQAARLIRRELFFSGWRATIDGRSSRVSRVGLFQSVHVPVGKAAIRFAFVPPYTAWAYLIAILGVFVWSFAVMKI